MNSKKNNEVQDNSQKSSRLVVHPLNDAEEQKVDTSQLGPMPLTLSVRVSLLILRGYLILMTILILYHFLDLAGLFTKRWGQ